MSETVAQDYEKHRQVMVSFVASIMNFIADNGIRQMPADEIESLITYSLEGFSTSIRNTLVNKYPGYGGSEQGRVILMFDILKEALKD